MDIRPEAPADWAAIREVHRSAFAHHPFSHQTEHLIVEALRAQGALTLSLVAVVEGEVAGHIAFSSVKIDGRDRHWFALGPVGVRPARQKQGIGSSLVRHGLKFLREGGADGCILVGEPDFYGRFGFRCCVEMTIENFPPEVVLCLPFSGRIPDGKVEHHPAFWVTADSDAAS